MARRNPDPAAASSVATTVARARKRIARLERTEATTHEWRRMHMELLSEFVQAQRGFIRSHTTIIAQLRSGGVPLAHHTGEALAVYEELNALYVLLKSVERHVAGANH